MSLEEDIGKILKNNKYFLVIAESCSGGLLADKITDVAGASDYFERGFVTYSNEAKIEELGVPPDILAKFGAVSAETAAAMAEGALQRSRADIAVAVTGIAGPGGGTAKKPVGTVFIGLAGPDGVKTIAKFFPGERRVFKEKVVAAALSELEKYIERKES